MSALPSRSVRRAALPGAGQGSAGLPAGSWTRLPARFLYEPPPAALFAGVGVLSAIGAPVATAVFSGAGLLAAAAAGVASAGFSGAGEFKDLQNEAVAEFAGAGVLAVSAVPVATAVFSSEGVLAAGAAPLALAGFAGSGLLVASGTPRATAAFSGSGGVSAPAVTFSSSGMVLGTESATRFGTSFAQIPGTWVADTANHPGSTMSGNELVAQSGGTGLTIQASVHCHNNNSISATDAFLQLRVNGSGTPLATSPSGTSIPASGRVTLTLNAAEVTLAAGDVVRIEARAAVTNRIDAEINANTYVRIIDT